MEATPAAELQAAADEVRRSLPSADAYHAVVKMALYRNVELTHAQLQDYLLIALGALMTGSRRGSVRRVVTLNFDSVLEWYIALCGFVPSVVVEPSQLEGGEDVRIYHPHGFLAHPSSKQSDSSFLILGLESVNTRLGSIGDPWFELLRHLFRTSIGIFAGLSFKSFRDPALAPLLTTVGKEVAHHRPLGFWLLSDTDPEAATHDREMLSLNVVPLRLAGKSDVARVLLSICQRAGRGGFP